MRARLADVMMADKAFKLTVARTAEQAKAGEEVGHAASIIKYAAAKLNQAKTEFTVEAMGFQGLGWEGDEFTDGELEAVRGWLFGKATTIYGGSTEIQNNIIAKRVLGMLDHQ